MNMHKDRNKQTGFALLLVLLLLVVASVLGFSYVTTSTVKLVSSQNLLNATRAQYLAESGLQHALYILQADPELLAGSAQNPLGPFNADNTEDCYYLYVVPDEQTAEKYYVTAEAHVGEVKRSCYYTVFSSAEQRLRIPYGMIIGGAGLSLPDSLTVNGDVHHNGSVFLNYAHINGDVSSFGVVMDPFGWIDGEVSMGVEQIEPPDITTDYYKSYNLGGRVCTAAVKVTDYLNANDSLNAGGSISEDNVGGVVWLKPDLTNKVRVNDNVDFVGTIIVEGDLVWDGRNITLTAVDGFPAIVTTGAIVVAEQAEASVHGVIIAHGGIISEDGTANGSLTTINGGLISNWIGYESSLNGTHQLNYVLENSLLYDFSVQGPVGEGTGGSIRIVDYK